MTTAIDRTAFAPSRSDSQLLCASSLGDERAFRELFDRHAPAVRRYVGARVGPDACDDVVVETFVAAWRARDRFQIDASSARPWLLGIATVQARRHGAAEARWRERISRDASMLVDDAAPDPADLPLGATPITRAVALLSPAEREVLLLVALGELTVTEAARSAGMSPVAARMRLHRARRRIRQVLEDEGVTP